jgi:hypothetical protein
VVFVFVKRSEAGEISEFDAFGFGSSSYDCFGVLVFDVGNIADGDFGCWVGCFRVGLIGLLWWKWWNHSDLLLWWLCPCSMDWFWWVGLLVFDVVGDSFLHLFLGVL